FRRRNEIPIVVVPEIHPELHRLDGSRRKPDAEVSGGLWLQTLGAARVDDDVARGTGDTRLGAHRTIRSRAGDPVVAQDAGVGSRGSLPHRRSLEGRAV